MSNFVNTVDSVGDEALTSSIIDKSITEIRDNYATSIGNYAFNGCWELTTANFPAVTYIGTNAFYSCTKLTTVDFPAVTSISSYAFQDCTELTTADFPAVTKIGTSAFQGCKALTTVDFPAVTNISESAFSSCSKLTTANFSAVTKIGDYAFSGCWELTTADFPAATSIGGYAFRDCYKLTTVILRSATMATLSNANAFKSTSIQKGTGYIYVPAALVDSYKAANNWSTYVNQIRAIEDYPEVCDPYSWEAVAKHIELGDYATFYKVGDCVPLDLGSEGVVNMQIAAFDADDLADGSGKAPISWISKELLATTHRMNPALVTNDDGTYQEGTGSIGGWEKSEMRIYLKEIIKPMIPETVCNSIKSIQKTNTSFNSNGKSEKRITTDDVFLPSVDELNGGIYSGLFEDKDGLTQTSLRIKCLVGYNKATPWWQAGAGTSRNFFRMVDKTGSVTTQSAPETLNGVCLCFCT